MLNWLVVAFCFGCLTVVVLIAGWFLALLFASHYPGSLLACFIIVYWWLLVVCSCDWKIIGSWLDSLLVAGLVGCWLGCLAIVG